MADRPPIRPGRAGRLACAAALFLVAHASVAPAQSDTLWQYSSPSKIIGRRFNFSSRQFLVISEDHLVALDADKGTVAWDLPHSAPVTLISDDSLGLTLVAFGTSITAIDYRTGQKVWERSGFPDFDSSYVMVPRDGKAALVQSGTSLTAFDPRTGAALWDARETTPGSAVRDFILIPSAGVVLLFLEDPASKASVAAVSRESGTLLWRQDSLFSELPAYRTRDGVSSLNNWQFLHAMHDSLFVVYTTTDGPIGLDGATGAIRWRGAALRGRKVASVTQDYMQMCLCAGHLIVPAEKGVVALDPATGALRWEKALPDKATSLRHPREGLLFLGLGEGSSYATLVDTLSGAAKWMLPLDREDEVLLDREGLAATSDGTLLEVPYATGQQRALITVKFKDRERPQRIMTRPGGGYLLVARQNLAGIGPDGKLIYQRFYRAPDPSFGEKLLSSYYQRKGRAHVTRDIYYALTDAPDSAGQKYFSIVAIRTEDGIELRRMRVGSRDPNYFIDLSRGRIYFTEDKQRVVARDFGIPEKLLPHPVDAKVAAAATDSTPATDD